MISDQKIDFWLSKNWNVLIEGRRGVGKSTRMIEGAIRNNIKFMYFSAATMDPFTDFVGTPFKDIDPASGRPFINFLRPKRIEDDDVELMIFDEFNRAKPKIRNAVLELIQFKSINGRVFKNLRMIWAAVNPESDEDSGETYNVEPLDPAERDRFQIITQSEYAVDEKWFKDRFGEEGKIGAQWWESLGEKFKNIVSPRRLQYALEVYNEGGDVADVLPPQVNFSQLIAQLSNGSFQDKLRDLKIKGDAEANAKALLNENFYTGTINIILNNQEYLDYFCDYLPDEKFNSLLMANPKFRDTILQSKVHMNIHKEQLQQIVEVGSGAKAVLQQLRTALINLPEDEKPTIDNISQLYSMLSDTTYFDNHNKRLEATAALKNVDYQSLSLDKLKKATLVNCYIAARCAMDMWGETKTIFKKINENAVKHKSSLAEIYLSLKKDALFIQLFNSPERISRLEERFRNHNLMPTGMLPPT